MSEHLPDLAIVIMAGGAGTRFWPLSTEERPKQFLTLFGARSLLQQSYDRAVGLVPPSRVLVLTSARSVDLVRRQLPELPSTNVIGEPVRRDTAAAVALAALLCRYRLKADVMAVLTADHRIAPTNAFHAALRSAVRGAETHPRTLYTFGIRPRYPATAYGYLWLGNQVKRDDNIPHFELKEFREKPDLKTAQAYVATGEYCWNSGMFVWTVDAIMKELERSLPGHINHIRPVVELDDRADFNLALKRALEPLHPTSIDFGVMERAEHVHCVEAPFEWSDVGGWDAVAEFLEHDARGNAHRGGLHTLEANANIVFCDDESEQVALLGVRDLVVVRAGNRTLVMTRERAEDIKHLVNALESDLR